MKVKGMPDSGWMIRPEGEASIGLWEGFPERRHRMKKIIVKVSSDCGCEELLEEILEVVQATKDEVFKQSAAAKAAEVAEVKSILEPPTDRLEAVAGTETVPTPPPA